MVVIVTLCLHYISCLLNEMESQMPIRIAYCSVDNCGLSTGDFPFPFFRCPKDPVRYVNVITAMSLEQIATPQVGNLDQPNRYLKYLTRERSDCGEGI